MRVVSHMRCQACLHEWNSGQPDDDPVECPNCGAEAGIDVVGHESTESDDDEVQLMIALEEEEEY